MTLQKIAVLIAVAAAIPFGIAAPVTAQVRCDNPRVADRLPKPPDGCQKERITASGNLSFGIFRSAQSLGEKAWTREALNKYGERFSNWENAACPKAECVKAAVSGSTRCTYSGYPCASKQFIEGATELTKAEISELQSLLGKSGHKVPVDGNFGPRSTEALSAWQDENGITPPDGVANKANLEALRRKVR